MEENISSNKSFLPMGIGILGVVLGAAGLIVAVMATIKADAVVNEFKDKIDRVAAVSIEMKNVTEKINSVASQMDDVKSASTSTVDSLARNVQSALQSLSKNIEENRTAIEQTQNAVKEFGTRGGRASVKNTEARGESTPSENAGKKYTIASGDTFGSIARKFKVKISAIESANPNVDSRKLHIGQEINLP